MKSFRRRDVLGAGIVAALPVWARAAALDRSPEAAVLAVSVGDVTPDSGILWVQSSTPTTVDVVLRAGSGERRLRLRTSDALGGTATSHLGILAPGTRYQVEAIPAGGPPAQATFRTPGAGRSPVRLVWSGDVVGQGYGIDRARGGLFAFDAMAAESPDLFVFSGDTVYADGPLAPSFQLPDGSTWNNVTTPAKLEVAETLEAFRGQYRYNWLDEAYRRFFSQVPVVAQWDDHETLNNWYPGRPLDGRYALGQASSLAARARRAFDEAFPRSSNRIARVIRRGPLLDVFVVDCRSYRSSNRVDSPEPHAFLGGWQARWLAEELRRSQALWKVVACDMPVGLVVGDGPGAIEAVADGTLGDARFRERELQGVLAGLNAADVKNVVFVTADVHYAAAHRYRRPYDFWEFVAGPLHAGQFGPAELDPTFGSTLEYCNRRPGDPMNAAPSPATASYGVVDIDPRSRAMTVDLKDGGGRLLHRQKIRAR